MYVSSTSVRERALFEKLHKALELFESQGFTLEVEVPYKYWFLRGLFGCGTMGRVVTNVRDTLPMFVLPPYACTLLAPHALRVQFVLLVSKVNALVPYTKSCNNKIRVVFIVCPSIILTVPGTRAYSHDDPHTA